MNTKFRSLYLILGFAGLLFLIYRAVATYPDISPSGVLFITLPDILFFYLAYRTYPVEATSRSRAK
jgi:hypothetical protein